MKENIMIQGEKDEELWKQAKARADFKMHLAVYLVVNGGLWLLWIFTSGVSSHPWPVWPTIGWGIGLTANYFAVYRFNHAAEKEYEKLKRGSHTAV